MPESADEKFNDLWDKAESDLYYLQNHRSVDACMDVMKAVARILATIEAE